MSLHATIGVDGRDPKEWGTHPVRLWVDPVLNEMNFRNFEEIVVLLQIIRGPLQQVIMDALKKIDPELLSRRYWSGL